MARGALVIRAESFPGRRVLHLVYSNRTEELLAALADALAQVRRARGDPLAPAPPILVPNLQVATAVKLAVARRDGVAAGLSFPYIDRCFSSCIAEASSGARALDRGRLQLLLYGALGDPELLAERELASVRAYLDAAGADADARSLRRVQLASQLAGLYEGYAHYRPAFFEAWAEGRLALTSSETAATETWQRRLWLELARAERGRAIPAPHTGEPLLLLPHAFERLPAEALGLPDALFAIGFSHLSPGYQAMFARAAEVCELFFYAQNPCMEFWEDLPSGMELRAARRKLAPRGGRGARELDAEGDPPALRLWGRPGRETIRMLDEISACDFEPRFFDPAASKGADGGAAAPGDAERGDGISADGAESGPTTALRLLQSDILTRRAPSSERAASIAPGDHTIRILACPSARRELEIIGTEIRTLIDRDESLRYSDVALLVPRSAQDVYQAQVGAVFHELGDIPHHVVDRPLHLESRYAEALELLLDLPLGRFTRAELLRVLTHPAVAGDDSDVDPRAWIRWAEALGVAHGADRRDHANTYIEDDAFHWEQALRRLALGAAMTGPRSGADRTVGLGASEHCPEELAPGDIPSAARLVELVRALVADARFARTAELTLAEWRQFFDALAATYLRPITDADERHLASCRSALAGLAELDLEGRAVDFRTARELARGALDSLRTTRGELFADGVMVAPLSPMRPLPFRVVFAAGLGEGQFPSSERESPMDLRAADTRRGDVSARERDRYSFLEAILSARDHFVASYVARDEESGEELAPASVVSELADLVESGYRPQGGAAIATRFPLRAFDPRCFPDVYAAAGQPAPEAPVAAPASAAARSQAGARAMRLDLARHLRETRAMAAPPSPDALRSALSRPDRRDLRARLGGRDPAAERPGHAERGSGVSVALGALYRFLDDPLQAWAQTVLRLREEDFDDPMLLEDEPFSVGAAARAALLRDSFAAYMRAPPAERAGGPALSGAYDRERGALARAGRAPVGLFSEIERAHHLAVLESWRRAAEEREGPAAQPATPVYWGSVKEHAAPDRVEPPLALEIPLGGEEAQIGARGTEEGSENARLCEVIVEGRGTQLVSADDAAIWALDTANEPRSAMLLRALVDHALLSAAGRGDGKARRLHHVSASKSKSYRLAPFTRDEARAQLSALLTDLLTQSHDYLLPGGETVRALRNPGGRPLAERIRASQGRGRPGREIGVVRRLSRFAPPPEADALARRRIAPLLDKAEEEA